MSKTCLIVAGHGTSEKGASFGSFVGEGRNIWGILNCFEADYIKWDNNSSLIKQVYDYVFLVIEESFDKFKVKDIRKSYPKANIIAYSKEHNPCKPLSDNLLDVYFQCNKVMLPFRQEYCDKVAKKIGRKVYSLPYPYDIEIIRKQYYISHKNRNNAIFIGASSEKRGREKSIMLAMKLAKDYRHEVDITNNVPWSKWLQRIAQSRFVINCDPEDRISQVAIECAILGTPCLGGIGDATKELYGTYSNNEDVIIERFKHLLDKDLYTKEVEEAYKKVVGRHSFENIRNKFWEYINE